MFVRCLLVATVAVAISGCEKLQQIEQQVKKPAANPVDLVETAKPDTPPPMKEPVPQRPAAPTVPPEELVRSFLSKPRDKVDNREFAKLVEMPEGHELLPELSFRGTKMTSALFKDLPRFQQLKTLDLVAIQSASMADAKELLQLTSIESLSIGSENFPDTVVPLLANMKSLKTFHSEENDWSDESLAQFFVDHPLLETVGLYNVRQFGPLAGAALGKLSQLQTLDLKSGSFNDDAISQWGALTALKTLSLQGCSKVTCAGLAKSVSGGGLGELQVLNVSSTALNERGANAIGQLSSLRVLHMANLNPQDQHLKFLRNLKQLEELSMSQCSSITSKGLLHLSGLTELKKLDLTSLAIDDKGLAALAKLGHLEKLSLRNTGVSGNGVAQLKKGIPQLEVEFGK